jgi:hypothetical protein
MLHRLQDEKLKLERSRNDEFNLADILNLNRFKETLSNAVSASKHKTYFGYLDARSLCDRALQELSQAFTEAQSQHRQRTQQLLNEQRRREAEEQVARAEQSKRARGKATPALWLSSLGSLFCPFVVPVGFVLGLISLAEFSGGNDKDGRGKAIAAVVIGSFWTCFFLLYLLGAFK